MNITEYNKVKDYSYTDYCNYLLEKYGAVPYDYFDKGYNRITKNSRTKDGLVVHHIKENEFPKLSDPEFAKKADFSMQRASELVYCDWLEHYLLHLMIAEQYGNGLGIGGIVNYMDSYISETYNGNYPSKSGNCPNAIKDDKGVYDLLRIRRDSYIEECESLLFEHNIGFYEQVEDTFSKSDRALIVLGTGLGKTTTALEYIRRHCVKALVLAPQKNIVEMWNDNDGIDSLTYMGFANRYRDIDYSKYGVLICDEAHHICAPRWGEGIRYVLDNKIMPVIGLTATPKEERDKHTFSNTREFFNNNVCEGYDIVQALQKDIIHPFSYVGAIYDTESIREEYADVGDTELLGELDLAINNTPTVKDILLKNMPDGRRKGIIFVSNIPAIEEAINILKDVFPNVEYRPIHSWMDDETIKCNKEWFENTDEGYLVSVDMVSEGAHYSGINTLIMFRRTGSYIKFNQQLGRIVVLKNKPNPNGIVFDLVNNAQNVRVGVDNEFFRQLRETLVELGIRTPERTKSEQIIVKDYTADICDVLSRFSFNSIADEPVYCVETDEFFESCNEASVHHGVRADHIKDCCRGVSKSVNGRHYFYQSDLERVGLMYKIVCLNDMKKFLTIKSASDYYGVPYGDIWAVCNGLQGTCRGLTFSYYDKGMSSDCPNKVRDMSKKFKKIMCVETKKVFVSCKEASMFVGTTESNISACANGRSKTAGGYTWKYI